MLDAILEEMIRAWYDRVLDQYAFLCLELFNKARNLLQRRDAILVSVHEKARRRTGCEKRKVEAVGGRCNGDEAFDLWPPHQELHSNPGTKRNSGNPTAARFRIDRLCPVKSRRGIGQFALTVIEAALRASDATKIEPQHGKAALRESVIKIINDLVVHRPAELRMRVQDNRKGGPAHGRGVKPALDAAGRPIEHHLRHSYSTVIAQFM